MPQILIVSNRLPVTVKKDNGKLIYEASMGGVATGLSSFVKSRKNKWIGWPGIASEDLTETEKNSVTTELAKRNCVPVFLTRRQMVDFYNGFSNSLLWPLFHNLPMIEAEPKWWKAYKTVNAAFKEVTLAIADKNSSIWVQDYQLMLLPDMLKTAQPRLHVGFFLHIPFPTFKMYSKLPEAEQLVHGMLGADLIGFHTSGYVNNFVKTVQSFDLALAVNDQLVLPDRTIQVTDFPMGIDYEKFTTQRKTRASRAAAKLLKRKYKGKRIIAGVDRLDITKGFVERLEAYREFLRQYPKQHNKIVFVLVGAPSRGEIEAYKALSRQVSQLVDEINDEFGTKDWLPVDYNDKGLNFEEVTALFQIADVAFVAPLRDGMNLVAKEYIASKKKNGVLILSDTAGAAQELQDALLVSHKKPATLVAAIDQALNMRKREVRGRFKRMQKHLADNTVHTWANDFVTTLQKPLPGTPRLLTRTLDSKMQLSVMSSYIRSTNRLILLDYDGTLAPFHNNYDTGKVPKSLISTLTNLADDVNNTVVIVSGRSAPDLDDRFSGMRLSLVAEHGAMTKMVGHKRWQTLDHAESSWKRKIIPILIKYAQLTPLAQVEEKPHSLVWHYRQSPPYYAQKYVVVLKRVLKPLLKDYNLALFQGNKILEIKNPIITKGAVVKKWHSSSYDFIMAIGDDYTDEDMFTALPAASHTIKVRSGRTAARYRLSSDVEVRDFLKKITKRSVT